MREKASPSDQRRTRRTLGDPYGIRTRVAAVKGRCPRPLDEGVSLEARVFYTLI